WTSADRGGRVVRTAGSTIEKRLRGVNDLTPRSRRSSLRGVGEGDFRAARGGQGDFGGLFPELLVPGLEDVVPRRDALERERAAGRADGERRVVDDAPPGLHPRVEVALEGHGHLGLRRLPLDGLALRRLRRVLRLVAVGADVDVVREVVVVLDEQS